MIDERAGSGGQSGAPEESNSEQMGAASGRVAFCQQCGRELTADTVRRAGSAVFCEPCLVARLGGAGTGYQPVNPGAAPGYGAPPVNPDAPNPGLAALLGLIPGVGAMYNGQFAKGVAHLVIFAILVSLSDNVNGIFGLFVAGWIFYQSFEAYHTAKARREGLPLPNPFGLNDIGDRMGFGKNWPGSASRPVSTAQNTGWNTTGSAAAPTPPPPGPTSSWNTNWAGYVPPTSFGATAPAASGQAAAAEAASASAPNTQPPPPAGGWGPGAYGATYVGEPWTASAGAAVTPLRPVRRFPVGAMWLIGLGVLFLLSNLAPGWRITGHWLVPIVLAALAIWVLYQRVDVARRMAEGSGETTGLGPEMGRRLACQIRWPVMLLVLAMLFALQAGHVLTLGQTWPVLFIAFGALLVLERTVGRGGWYAPVGIAGAADYGRPNWTAGQTGPQKDGK